MTAKSQPQPENKNQEHAQKSRILSFSARLMAGRFLDASQRLGRLDDGDALEGAEALQLRITRNDEIGMSGNGTGEQKRKAAKAEPADLMRFLRGAPAVKPEVDDEV